MGNAKESLEIVQTSNRKLIHCQKKAVDRTKIGFATECEESRSKDGESKEGGKASSGGIPRNPYVGCTLDSRVTKGPRKTRFDSAEGIANQ